MSRYPLSIAAALALAALTLAGGHASAELIYYLKLDDSALPTAANEVAGQADGAYEAFGASDLQQAPSPGKDSIGSVRFGDLSVAPYQRILLGQEVVGAKALTIALWVNLDAGQLATSKDHALASLGKWGFPANLLFWRDGADADGGANGTLAALVNGSRVNGADEALNTAGWHHVAMTWAANTTDGFRLYVDGVRTKGDRPAVDVGDEVIGANEGPRDLVLGNKEDAGGEASKDLVGLLDEVGVWTDALPADWIAMLADGTHTPATVPEPNTLVLLAVGMLAVLYRLRR